MGMQSAQLMLPGFENAARARQQAKGAPKGPSSASKRRALDERSGEAGPAVVTADTLALVAQLGEMVAAFETLLYGFVGAVLGSPEANGPVNPNGASSSGAAGMADFGPL